jgi:hypothetical protein
MDKCNVTKETTEENAPKFSSIHTAIKETGPDG